MIFFFNIIIILFLVIAGCAPKWAINYDIPQTEIQWPYPPKEPVIIHKKNITGFSETEAVSLKSIIYGKDRANILRPVAVAVGKDGRLAIADTECLCVHLYIPKEERYIMITKSGKDELNSPVGVIFDEEFKLYVSDSVLKNVSVYDEKGNFIRAINKVDGFLFKRPTGLAYNDEKKILYIVDTLEHRFYGINKEGRLAFFRGTRGTGDYEFNFPTHIFWSSGIIYITDSMNFRIQAFDSNGKFLFKFGQHGNGSGDFAMPKGVAADKDGIIYVVDALFDNIQLFDENGEFLLFVGGRGSFHGEFWLPHGIFIDNNTDTMYVCDTYNRRVQIFQIMKRFNRR